MNDSTDSDAQDNARERWRASHEPGADACKNIALAFELAPDLLIIKAFRDLDDDLVDIETVWADPALGALHDRELALAHLRSAEATLTECHEFSLHGQFHRRPIQSLNTLSSIAASLSMPKAQAYLEAFELRASIANPTQDEPPASPAPVRL